MKWNASLQQKIWQAFFFYFLRRQELHTVVARVGDDQLAAVGRHAQSGQVVELTRVVAAAAPVPSAAHSLCSASFFRMPTKPLLMISQTFHKNPKRTCNKHMIRNTSFKQRSNHDVGTDFQ